MKEYNIVRSGRRTIAIEITRKGEVIVRAPFAVSEAKIRQFVTERSDWIEKHLAGVKSVSGQKKYTPEEINRLADEALKVIPDKVKKYADILNISYGRITIRNQKTRWGSCSSKGNLNFNCLLMLTPGNIIDYVVVHELCHRVEMNHSQNFWAKVGSVLPDYRQRREWLKTEGSKIIGRLD